MPEFLLKNCTEFWDVRRVRMVAQYPQCGFTMPAILVSQGRLQQVGGRERVTKPNMLRPFGLETIDSTEIGIGKTLGVGDIMSDLSGMEVGHV